MIIKTTIGVVDTKDPESVNKYNDKARTLHPKALRVALLDVLVQLSKTDRNGGEV